jgi:DNA gyrase/topoisomerase IV subunit A
VTSDVGSAAHDRLGMVAAMRSALDRRDDLIHVLTDSDDEPSAVRAVRSLLDCDAEQAIQVLGLQVRRLTRQSRARLADESLQLTAPSSESVSLLEVGDEAPPSGTLYIRSPRPAEESRLLPAKERAERREQAVVDRREILRALAHTVGQPSPIFGVVHDANDPESAVDRLTTEYGWTPAQAAAVLDMQFRRLLPDNQRSIEAELESDL